MAIPSNYIDKINKDGDSRPICPAADKVRVENQNFESGDLDGALNELAGGKANKDETYTKEEVNEKVPLRIPATKNGDVITSTTDYAKIDNAVKEDWRDAYVVVNNESIFSFYQVEQNAIIFTRVDAEDGTQAYLAVSSNNVWSIEYSAISGGGYEPPVGGIPKTDLAPGVQTSLGLADTAVQDNDYTHTDNNYTDAEQTKLAGLPTNPVTSISVNGQSPQTPSNGNVNLVVQAGAQGPKGDTGNVEITDAGDLVTILVNDLTTGGAGNILSAEMGKRLALMSGTFAQAWARSKAIPFPFCFLWNETIDGDAISKPIWHKGNSVFVDAAGAIVNVSALDAPDPPTITGATSGDSVPKNTQITITPASGSALYYSLDGGTTYNVSDAAVTIALTTAGSVSIVAYCANNAGNSSNATLSVTVAGTAVPTFAAKPNSGTTLTQKTGYIEVSRGGYVRISGTENGTLYYSTDGENYTEVQGNNYYDFQIANSSYETTAFVIYAKNKVGNEFSDPVTGTFKMAALAAPSFSPADGTLPLGGDTVEITHTDNNVEIFYTTDGSTPTDQSTQYDPQQPISVTSSMTIKAIAKDDYGTSEVASAYYSVPVDHKFQFKIKLTDDNSREYIPVSSNNVTINGVQVRKYTMTVDWGDGTTTECNDSLYSAKGLYHDYTGAAGTEFTITLRGSIIPSLLFGNGTTQPESNDLYYNSASLVAILENSLECDTLITLGSKRCVNCTYVCADALQNNIGTWTNIPAGLASLPDGLLSHLTKTGVALTSCRKMFDGFQGVITASQMQELRSVIGSVTDFNSTFFDFTGVCDIPDNFFDNVANESVTTFFCFVDGTDNGVSNTVTGDSTVLQSAINQKKTSNATTTACLRGLKARTS